MIPKTDILLKEKEIQELADKYGRQAVVGILQEILQELREKAAELADGGREEEGAEVIGQTIQQLPGRVHERLEQLFWGWLESFGFRTGAYVTSPQLLYNAFCFLACRCFK